MSRRKAIAKGCKDPVDGFDEHEAREFFDACRRLRVLRARVAREDALSPEIWETERAIGRFIQSAVQRRNFQLFARIAARLAADPVHKPLDPVGAGILEFWKNYLVEQVCAASGERFRLSPPRMSELLRYLEAVMPGRTFSEGKLRLKAKKFGVVFAPSGRPRSLKRIARDLTERAKRS